MTSAGIEITYRRMYLYVDSVFTARSELRKVLFLAPSVTFCLCMKYLGNRWKDLRQIQSINQSINLFLN